MSLMLLPSTSLYSDDCTLRGAVAASQPCFLIRGRLFTSCNLAHACCTITLKLSIRSQERFENQEAVYVERSAPTAEACARPDAGQGGLDDGVPDFKGSATKVRRRGQGPGPCRRSSCWLLSPRWALRPCVLGVRKGRRISEAFCHCAFQVPPMSCSAKQGVRLHGH